MPSFRNPAVAACMALLACRWVGKQRKCTGQEGALPNASSPRSILSPAAAARTSAVALPDGAPYAVGALANPVHLWVNPATGADSRTGATRALALKTFKAAWSKVPGKPSRPHIIHLLNGTFNQAQTGEWLQYKNGSYAAPIVVQAEQGASATFNAHLSIRFCKYLYFIGIRVSFLGDADGSHPFHCEGCTGLLLRKVHVRGSVTAPYKTREAVKFNQCKGVYVEGCDFAVSTDNAIDAVAVQYGHVISSRLHDVGFGVYFKGGSAYILIAGNEVYRTGELGIAAGFDTGFEWMMPPWLRYDAYDIKIVNNVIHDVDAAAGVSVYGGYNILVAHNTLYRIGKDAMLFRITQGLRSCDDDYPERCTRYYNAGGWGTKGSQPKWTQIRLPNKNVIIANNLAVNPAGYETNSGMFYVPEPRQYCHEYSDAQVCAPSLGLPTTLISADDGLVIRGNAIWSGADDPYWDLGIHDEPGWCCTGCRNTHPGCSRALVLARNDINNATAQPRLADPAHGSYRLKPGLLPAFGKLWSIPKFGAWAAGLAVPAGNQTNLVLTDRTGALRTAANNAPGAYVRA